MANTQHKSYQWHLEIKESTWQTTCGRKCPPYVNEENKEAWERYLSRIIEQYLKEETMQAPEFQEIEQKVREEKLFYNQWKEKEEHKREAERYRRQMEKPKINYIPQGLTVDYEKEYAKYFMQEVTFIPKDKEDFMYQLRLLECWHRKSIPQILAKNRPDAAYAIAIGLCRHLPLLINRDDIAELVDEYKSRIRKLVLSSYKALVETVKAWNNEPVRQFVCEFIKSNSKEHRNFRGLEKKILMLTPVTPFTGDNVTVERE